MSDKRKEVVFEVVTAFTDSLGDSHTAGELLFPASTELSYYRKLEKQGLVREVTRTEDDE